MSSFLDEREGQNTRQNINDDMEPDQATANWLKDNKLNHLIKVFAEESITIDELIDMDHDTLNTFLDELVNDDTIKKFKKRDKLRVINKLKSKDKKNKKIAQEQKQQSKPQRIIITEAETSALDSLDNKYNELSLQEKSIEDRLNEFEKEYIKQQKILNAAFNQIILNVETRRNALLNEMKQKRNEYKTKLGNRRQSVANQRSLLNQIKSKCENDINNSGITSLKDAQKRANKTVNLIDETLLSISELYDDSKINKEIYVKFNISNNFHDDIKQWGNVKIIGDKPPAPNINFVYVKGNNFLIELLCDESYSETVSKYEYELKSQGAMLFDNNNYSDFQKLAFGYQNQTEAKEHTIIKEIVNNNDTNVVFGRVPEVQSAMTDKIRARAVIKDNVRGDWSQWFSCDVTNSNKKNRRKRKKVPFRFDKECITMREWCKLCNERNASLSTYQLHRIFYFTSFQDGGYGQMSIKYADAVRARSIFIGIMYKMVFASGEWERMQDELVKIFD